MPKVRLTSWQSCRIDSISITCANSSTMLSTNNHTFSSNLPIFPDSLLDQSCRILLNYKRTIQPLDIIDNLTLVQQFALLNRLRHLLRAPGKTLPHVSFWHRLAESLTSCGCA